MEYVVWFLDSSYEVNSCWFEILIMLFFKFNVFVFAVVFAVVSMLWTGVIGTSDNLTDVVTWDRFSLMVKGERMFIL